MDEQVVTVLPLQCVSDHWYALRPMIASGLEHANGELDADDVYELVMRRRMFVVGMVEDGAVQWAAACECINYPKKSVLYVTAIGGKHLSLAIRQFWEQISEIARALGASVIRGAVRPAMQRYYRRYAPESREVYAVMERAV